MLIYVAQFYFSVKDMKDVRHVPPEASSFTDLLRQNFIDQSILWRYKKLANQSPTLQTGETLI
jgi:hypothetical protein